MRGAPRNNPDVNATGCSDQKGRLKRRIKRLGRPKKELYAVVSDVDRRARGAHAREERVHKGGVLKQSQRARRAHEVKHNPKTEDPATGEDAMNQQQLKTPFFYPRNSKSEKIKKDVFPEHCPELPDARKGAAREHSGTECQTKSCERTGASAKRDPYNTPRTGAAAFGIFAQQIYQRRSLRRGGVMER